MDGTGRFLLWESNNVDSDDDSDDSILNDPADGGDAGGGSGNGEDDTAVSPKPNAAAAIINRLNAWDHASPITRVRLSGCTLPSIWCIVGCC